MSDVTFALGYFPPDNYKLKDERVCPSPDKKGKNLFLALNLMGYIPGLSIITGLFRAVIGVFLLCDKQHDFSKAFAAACIARGLLEAAGLGIAIGLLGDLPVTVYRFATMTKRNPLDI
jgi:hypothetical protein